MKKILISLCFFIFVFSCKNVEIAETSIVQEYHFMEHKKVKLIFDEDKLYGFTGVNNFNSNYSIKDGRLIVGNISITLALGSQKDMEVEQEILELLKSSPKIEMKNDVVKLTSNTGKIFIFK